MPRPVTVFLQHGNLGVALFFILSGFILYYSYQGNLQSFRDIYKFFVARFARLYPVYLLALLLGLLLDMRLPRGAEYLVFPMLQSWFPPVSPHGYSIVAQAWTLSVEAFFYCCFPFLILFFRRGLSTRALWLIAFAVFALTVSLKAPMFHSGMPPSWLANHILLPVLCLPEFVFGMTLGSLFLHKQRRNPHSSSNDWITVAGIVPCFLVIGSGAGDLLVSLAGVLCFGWVIYRLADGRGWFSTILSSKPLMLLGGASYSIYLLQSPNRIIARRVFGGLHPGLDAALAPFILIGASCLIFLFYEEPLRGLIRRLLTPKPARRLAS